MITRLTTDTAVSGNRVHSADMSLAEFADIYASDPGRNRANAEGCCPEPTEWYNYLPSLAAARATLDKGWKEGARQLTGLSGNLAADIPPARSRKRKPCWTDDGGTLDVDRALAGQWESAYRSATRVSCLGPDTVDLIGGMGGLGHITAEEMFWAGAAAIVAADILENAGYNVRLIAAAYSRFDDESAYTVTRVIVKDAGEPLRVDALAGVMCHSGIYRTHAFRARCLAPWDVGGMGRSVNAERIQDLLTRVGEWPESAIVLNRPYTREDAIAEIQRVIGVVQGKVEAA